MSLRYILFAIFGLLRLYLVIIIIGIILTWIPNSFEYKIPRMIRKMCEWYLQRFTGIVVIGSLDFTTIFGVLLYEGVLDLLMLTI